MNCIRLALAAFVLVAARADAQGPTIIRAGRLVDGRGGVQQNVLVVIRNGRIERVGGPLRSGETITNDLAAYTLLPGLIDTHVHIDAHFGPDGRATNQGETPTQRAYGSAQNAYVTLMAGYTTVQSIGSPSDSALVAALERGYVKGPRLLTSLGSLGDTTARFADGEKFVLEPEDRESGWVGRLRGIGGGFGFRIAGEIGAEEREEKVGLSARASLVLGL